MQPGRYRAYARLSRRRAGRLPQIWHHPDLRRSHGFRLGQKGAQGHFNVTPDLSIFAKAIANRFPVAATVGRADLMDMFATGGVLHGGTVNSQPVPMAAMIATQQALPRQGVRVLERGAWFVSSEHNDEVVDKTLEAIRTAAREVAPTLPS